MYRYEITKVPSNGHYISMDQKDNISWAGNGDVRVYIKL